jgi:hypothetical protein
MTLGPARTFIGCALTQDAGSFFQHAIASMLASMMPVTAARFS